jgi:selenocysteine-specific elongation factor
MIVGTAGHIDHGKTALVRALTGVDTDRLKEEKARGITIDLGFAYLPAADGVSIGFVDVPGHEKFVHTMVAGAGGVDFALLVVAADDGVMPQTREHVAIMDLLGLARGIVALTKGDLVSDERRRDVAAEIADLLAETSLAGSTIAPVSVVTGEGIDFLRDRLIEAARGVERHGSARRFRLAVDRSFVLPGVGTVVTGTVLSGAVAIDDRVTVSPSGIAARVRSIHAQNRAVDRGYAGDRCALNLAGDGVAKDAIRRGDAVLDPESHAPTDRIDATLRLLPSEPKSVTQWMPARLHHAAAEVGARLVPLGDRPIAPGEQAYVQLVLERPIAAAAGDRYVLRDTSARRTIGGGRFLDLRAPTRKRRTPERMAVLQACSIEAPDEALAALARGGVGYVDLKAFARDRMLGADEIDRLADRLGLVRIAFASTQAAFADEIWAWLASAIHDKVAAYHADNPDLHGIGRERLRSALHRQMPAPLFTAVLQHLSRRKDVVLDGAWVRLPEHQARLTAGDEAMWADVRPLIGGDERFRPPRVRDIAGMIDRSETDVRRLLKLLSRLGKVDEVAHDHFFLRDAVGEMVETVADLAEKAQGGQFTAAAFRDRLDNGRKVAIQILEFFDRHGVTLRRGDLRRINRHRFDLFRPAADQPLRLPNDGRESSLVGRPDFKSGRGREPVFGGFDSHSLPPKSTKTTAAMRRRKLSRVI